VAQKVVDGSLSLSVGGDGGGGGVHIRMQPSDDGSRKSEEKKSKKKKVVTLGLLPIIPTCTTYMRIRRLPKRGTLNIFPTK
jgi:hypothetical protein